MVSVNADNGCCEYYPEDYDRLHLDGVIEYSDKTVPRVERGNSICK